MNQPITVNFNDDEKSPEYDAELAYLSYHLPFCPINDKKIVCSLAQYARRLAFDFPVKFVGLSVVIEQFKKAIEQRLEQTGRAKKFDESDYEQYVAWKVWQFKSENPNYIVSQEGKGLTELYDISKKLGKFMGKVTKERKILQEVVTEEEWREKGFKRLEDYANQLTNVLSLTSKIINNTNNFEELNKLNETTKNLLIAGDNNND